MSVGEPRLVVRLERPGFFVTDVRLVVSLDGHPIYDGSFVSGFEREGPLTPGSHRLETRIELGALARTRVFELSIEPAGTTVAVLRYSRFWGNFKKALELSHVS